MQLGGSQQCPNFPATDLTFGFSSRDHDKSSKIVTQAPDFSGISILLGVELCVDLSIGFYLATSPDDLQFNRYVALTHAILVDEKLRRLSDQEKYV